MTKILWNQPNESKFETGIDRGVLYVDGMIGVPWHGLIGFVESPVGGEARSYYLDGVKYLNVSDSEELEGTIEAFYCPKEFYHCDGIAEPSIGVNSWQQYRKSFGFSFRTKVGNDSSGSDFSYKIHLVYNALATPTERTYSTVTDTSDPNTLSWSITTKALPVPYLAPTAHITIDLDKASAYGISILEDILYGTNLTDPRIPSPSEVIAIFSYDLDLVVVENVDGSFEVTGPSNKVSMFDIDQFQITSEAVDILDDGEFLIYYNN